MRGEAVVDAVKKKLCLDTDTELASALGISIPRVQRFKSGKITPLQMANLVKDAKKTGQQHLEETAIFPLVEFYPIDKCRSKGETRFLIFSTKAARTYSLSYQAGLKEALAASHGIYIFFDSAGKAIYVGKARLQSLWREINLAFNRERGTAQKIKRVKHPGRTREYKPMNEVSRQICAESVPLHEMATYFSAYRVTDGLVNILESLLVRSFPHDLLNVKIEKAVCACKKKQ